MPFHGKGPFSGGITIMREIAVITGGGSGIGAACARKLAQEGAEVWLLDLNIAGAKSVETEIQDSGGSAHSIQIDVSDASAMEEAAFVVNANAGTPRALVTAAGIIESVNTVLDADLDAHDRLWAINYGGTLNACRSFGRLMREANSGAIVALGSINSYAALPLPAYCPSKTAILRLVEMLSVELGRCGVRVNGVAPTYVLTPGLQAKVDAGERNVDDMLRVNALKRMITPADIADVVAFLLSDAARAVTGHMMPVDAGYMSAVTFATFAGGQPWDDSQ
jgi:NAD(P)-dependent dehydrogenase (short-subunit alcohol dehydrogenase family)